MAANAGDDLRGRDLMIDADTLDHVGYDVKLHDLAVNDRIAGQILESQADQVKIIRLAAQFDHLDRAGAYVQARNALLFTEHLFCCSLIRVRSDARWKKRKFSY